MVGSVKPSKSTEKGFALIHEAVTSPKNTEQLSEIATKKACPAAGYLCQRSNTELFMEASTTAKCKENA